MSPKPFNTVALTVRCGHDAGRNPLFPRPELGVASAPFRPALSNPNAPSDAPGTILKPTCMRFQALIGTATRVRSEISIADNCPRTRSSYRQVHFARGLPSPTRARLSSPVDTSGGQTSPQQTLLVQSTRRGNAGLHMTFEGHRDREHPSVDIHAHGVRDWPPPLTQQSHDSVDPGGAFGRLT
jgi:hypothetical protein